MANNKYLSYLKRQDEYVETLEAKGENGFTLIATNAFVQSMRNSGYKSTATAISEFIDNSIEAFASRIDIVYEYEKSKGNPITNIAIIDNGLGMSPQMIRASVIWGGTDRFDSREGMGRFGFGLPSAAISITKNYEVFSKRKDGDIFSVELDIEKIIKKKIKNDSAEVDKAKVAKLPEFVMEYLKENKLTFNQGTVILIKKPDLLTSGFRSQYGFHKNISEHIGVTYREFLNNCEIFINSSEVLPIDPLFTTPGALYYDLSDGRIAENTGIDEIELKTQEGKVGKIRIRCSFLPFTQGSSKEEKARYSIMKQYNHSFFLVSRGGRLIDQIKNLNFLDNKFTHSLVNYDRNWSIELDFDPILDEEFGITVNKQQVNLSERLWDLLYTKNLHVIIRGLIKKQKEWRKDEIAKKVDGNVIRESEEIANEAEKDGLLPSTADVEPEKEELAKKKLENDAEEISKRTGKKKEEVLNDLSKRVNEKHYEIIFEQREGAPFYRVEQYGPQMKLGINTRHRFYTDFFSNLPNIRLKTMVELLLITLGSRELKSTGRMETFYQTERGQWSLRLQALLDKYDKKDPIAEAEEAEEETEEIVKD